MKAHPLLIVFSSLSAVVAGGFFYQRVGLLRDKERFPPPGRLIETSDGRHLHIQTSSMVQKRGSTAVLLEAGIAATSLSWQLVERLLAPFAKMISYDRAGLGWSNGVPRPITVESLAADLTTVLDATTASQPAILVAHSFGALPVLAVAHLHARRVAGIVLVDPVSIAAWATDNPEQSRRLALGVRLARRGGLLARVGLVRAALAALAAGSRRLPQIINRASSRSGRAVVERLLAQVRKMPKESWPAIRAHWSNPQSFYAMAEHLACLPAVVKAIAAMPPPAQIPITIISAASATVDELSERDGWAAWQPLTRHLRTKDTSHWLQLDKPELIADAVREMIDGVATTNARQPPAEALGRRSQEEMAE